MTLGVLENLLWNRKGHVDIELAMRLKRSIVCNFFNIILPVIQSEQTNSSEGGPADCRGSLGN